MTHVPEVGTKNRYRKLVPDFCTVFFYQKPFSYQKSVPEKIGTALHDTREKTVGKSRTDFRYRFSVPTSGTCVMGINFGWFEVLLLEQQYCY